MKIVVIGAGAMGCLFGAYLSKKNEVFMVDSYAPQVEALNQNGITVLEGDNSETNYKNIRTFKSGECDIEADLVIVFVKSTFSDVALRDNKNLFGKNTIVLTLQNGAGNDRKIEQYVKRTNVVIGTTTHNSINMGNGKVHHNGSGITTVGSNLVEIPALNIVKKTFEECGLEVEISDNIQHLIWKKLFVNLSINTFTAITRAPIGSMIENRYSWDFAEKLICEAVDVAEADGTHFSYREVLDMVHNVCEDKKNGFSSMSQDVMKGVKTEIDAINGAIVQQAKLYNVPVPYNTLIVDLIHAIEGAYKYHK